MLGNRWFGIVVVMVGLMFASSPTESAPVEIKMSASTAGGGASYVTEALGNMWTKHVKKPYKVKVMVEPIVSMTESFKRLDSKDIDIAWQVSAFAYHMKKGTRMYKKMGARTFYSLFWGGNSFLHIVTLDQKIKSIKDMKGKRISGKRPGSPTLNQLRKAVFKAAGLTDKDITLLSHTEMVDVCRQVKERVADVGISITNYPTAPFTELATAKKTYWISLPDKEIASAIKMQPYRMKHVMPAGVYPGQDHDVIGLRGVNGWFTRTDFDEELAYQMIKAVFDNVGEFHAYHAAAKTYILQDAASEMRIWPLHPGSVRYLKEKGLWSGELEAQQKKLLQEAGL